MKRQLGRKFAAGRRTRVMPLMHAVGEKVSIVAQEIQIVNCQVHQHVGLNYTDAKLLQNVEDLAKRWLVLIQVKLDHYGRGGK